MTGVADCVCPGCGLGMPSDPLASYDGYFNASAECWAVFGEAVAAEYLRPTRRTHQLMVDAYAVQHAGGPHPDKSVAVHLVGLHLVLDLGMNQARVPPVLQSLATRVTAWPHFVAPRATDGLTVADVALAGDVAAADVVLRWAEEVWGRWAPHHQAVAALARLARQGRAKTSATL